MRVIIPKSMRPEMLTRIHSSHLGAEACLRKAKDVLFWPQMSAEIKDKVSNCTACNEYLSKQTKEPLMTHEIPERPWSKVGIDIFTLDRQDYLIMVDYYSDYWEIDVLPDTTSETIVNCCKRQFSRHGIPDSVVSDNGPNLTSAEFSRFSSDWEFEHITSSPYHSQSNGKAESAVDKAKKLLKKTKRDGSDHWKAILDWRNTPTDGMKSSPVQRLMSRRTRTLLPTTTALLKPKIIEGVSDKIVQKRQTAKLYYDRNAKQLPDLVIGQKIRMAPLPNSQNKKWSAGTCLQKLSPRSYVVEVEGHRYRRNRKYIRATNEQCELNEPIAVPDMNMTDHATSTEMNQNSDNSDTNQGKLPKPKSVSKPKPKTSSDFQSNTSPPPTLKHTRTRTIRPPARYSDETCLKELI